MAVRDTTVDTTYLNCPFILQDNYFKYVIHAMGLFLFSLYDINL